MGQHLWLTGNRFEPGELRESVLSAFLPLVDAYAPPVPQGEAAIWHLFPLRVPFLYPTLITRRVAPQIFDDPRLFASGGSRTVSRNEIGNLIMTSRDSRLRDQHHHLMLQVHPSRSQLRHSC
jgi:hypothetical protein